MVLSVSVKSKLLINSTNLLVAPLMVLLTITHVWYSESSVGITETLSHTALPSSVFANRVASSKDLIVKNPVDNGDVSVIVTTLLATVAVKSESAFINVCRLVAVWLLLDVVWNLPDVADVADVKVVVVPSAFVKN